MHHDENEQILMNNDNFYFVIGDETTTEWIDEFVNS